MAFSAFGNPGGAMGAGVAGGGGANIQNGPDLEDIQTEARLFRPRKIIILGGTDSLVGTGILSPSWRIQASTTTYGMASR